jgi:hypothetical protein
LQEGKHKIPPIDDERSESRVGQAQPDHLELFGRADVLQRLEYIHEQGKKAQGTGVGHHHVPAAIET